MHYTIHPEHRLLYVVGRGRVTLDDLLDNLEQVAADPAYRSPMRKLVDYRHCEPLELTPAQCTLFTERKRALAERFANETCAIIVKEEVDFGMSRMHGIQMESTDIETNTFRSLEEGLRWLGVSAAPAQLGALP
jgi:hypothetical protein